MAIDKKPPQAAQANAKRGLELRKKYNRGGLSSAEARSEGIRSGVDSAKSISKGGNLSDDLIKAMARFNRFRNDYKPEKRESDGGQTAGTIAWLLWGGTEGVNWALRKSKEIDEQKTINIDDFIEEKVSDKVKEGLKNKVKDHNEEVGDVASKRTSLNTLEKVFNRGVGAFNTNPSSVRPSVSSPEQWAMARVNSFLYALKNGRYRNGKHDADLLPKGHPMNTTEKNNNMNKEYKSFYFEVKDYNEDREYFYFKGYASTFGNIDLGNDVIEKGAFQDTLQKNKFKILWQHKMSEPIGMPIKAHEDEKGLYIEARLPKDDDFVKGRVIPQMKCGSIDSMSIGYMVNDDEFEGKIRRIKSVNLFEVSLVSMPMNPLAVVEAFKSRDITKYLPENNKDEAEIILKDCFAKMANDFVESEKQKENIKIKSVQEITCMKDIETILKVKCEFSQKERKSFISKIKDFSKQRDVVDEVKELRDVIRGQDVTLTLNNFINDLKSL